MIRVCAWCKKELGEKEPLEDKRITHGMCEECLEALHEDEEKEEMNNGSNKLKKP